MMNLSLSTVTSVRYMGANLVLADFVKGMDHIEYLSRQLIALESRLAELHRVNQLAAHGKKNDLVKLGYSVATAAKWVKQKFAYASDEASQLENDITSLLHTIVFYNQGRSDITHEGRNFWYCEDFSCSRIFIRLKVNNPDLKRVLSQYNFASIEDNLYMLPYSENNAKICTYLKKRLDQ